MIELVRFAGTPFGTFGRLEMEEFQCYTVERPWLNNKRRESCIPAGTYQLEKGRFHRGGYDCYELMNVQGRSLIKIHVGNTVDDVIGCIAVGARLYWIAHKWAVYPSRETHDDFMRAMEIVEDPVLHITWSIGE